jgi:Prp8 binding protein
MLIASASDDASVMIWDPRNRLPIAQLKQQFPMTSVAFSMDSTRVFTAGIDPIIQSWDFRKLEIVDKFEGHTEAVTCLRLTSDGSYLASNSMDNSVRVWDVRAFVATETRFAKGFSGHMVSFNELANFW